MASMKPPIDTTGTSSSVLWACYERLSAEEKAICASRMEVIDQIDRLVEAGEIRRAVAVEIVTRRAGVARSTYYSWLERVRSVAPQDRLAALAPASAFGNEPGSRLAMCHPEAWNFFKSAFLRVERPSFAVCYRHMLEVAERYGWSPVPSERSLRRRLDIEIPVPIQAAMRSPNARRKLKKAGTA